MRSPVQRHTWPTSLRDTKPGSYVFDSPPTLVRTPWEFERSRRPPSEWSRTSSERGRLAPGTFDQLPVEILHCILDQLNSVHFSGSTLDVRYLHDDLRTLCLSSKRWHKVAHERLYREIWAPTNRTTRQKEGALFRKYLSRLQLLLRTLQGSSISAEMVRRIHVTADLASELEFEIVTTRPGQRKDSTVQTLSDVISACRNLEHLDGYAPMATGKASKLLTAISSCSDLKSHVWRLPPEELSSGSIPRTSAFVNFHTNWQQLQTLVLWQSPDGGTLPQGTVSAVVQRLPSLKRLMVRCLHPLDFHNGTLLMLPPLKHLRLEELHGITDQGLEQLAHSRLAFSLEGLTLCGLELTSLRTIQTLFTGLPRLQKFALHQDTSPELQQLYTVTSNNFALASPTLKHLHWDVIAPGHATAILANSIAAGKLPGLEKVKIPCDYDGAIQNLCRPIANQHIGSNDLHTLEEWESSATISTISPGVTDPSATPAYARVGDSQWSML